jgi:hypothetical protein
LCTRRFSFGQGILATHPLAFAAASIPYLAVVAAAVATLPRPWAVAVAATVGSAHALGVARWGWLLIPAPLLALAALSLVLGALAALARRRGSLASGA